MILKKPTPWGIIWGQLSTTPEQAKRMFGFEQDHDAKGIIIRRQKTKKGKLQLVVCNFKPKATFSPKQQKSRQLIAVLSKIIKQEKKNLINKTIWKPNKPSRFPHNMFTAANMSRIGIEHKWENMLITDGPLFPPRLTKAYYYPEENLLSIPDMDNDIGVGIFDTSTLDFLLFPPPNHARITIKNNLSTPILYLYKQENNRYSRSVPLIPEIK